MIPLEAVMMQSPEYSLRFASERRRDDRLDVALQGEALDIGGSRQPVRIRNLSHQGTMFEAHYLWNVGGRIWIFFPSKLAVNARIVWAHGGRYGCEFLRRLSPGELILAQARS